jgi:hypothetical protein
MTKLNKLKVGSLAVAMVLMSIVWSVAQTASPATGAQSTKPKYPAAAELKSYQADPANPELSNTRHALLQAKAELEAGKADNSMSQDQITSLTRRIEMLETKVKELSSSSATTTQPTTREKQAQMGQRDQIIRQVKETNNLTREQFSKLEPADQKFVLMNNATISDLVNASPSQMRTIQDNQLVVSKSSFAESSIEKQMHVLSHPEIYLVTEQDNNVSAVENQETGVKKHTISRSELNNLPADKRKAIEASKDFVITD